MAIRLCHSCAREVEEGDKVCRYCNAVLDQRQSIIEVMGDDGGFCFASNKNAYEDEALKNFKQEHIEISFEEAKSKAVIQSSIKKEDIEENIEEDFDENNNYENMYKGIMDIVKNPKDYVAFFVGMIGCILMFLATFLPIYITGENFIHRIYQNDMYYFGFFIDLLVVVASFVIIKGKQKYVIIPSIFSITLLVYLLIYFSKVEEFTKLGWGYYLLWIGSIVIITSAVLLGKSDEKNSRGDNRNIPLCKKDFVWMLITLVISMLIVGRLVDQGNALGNSTNIKSSNDGSANEAAIRIVVDDGNVELTIVDTYVIECSGSDAAIIKVRLNNMRTQAVSFDEVFTITAYQNNRQLELNQELDTEFDLYSADLLVGAGSSQDIYFGYLLESQEAIDVTVYKNSNNEVVFDKPLGLNDKFYVSEAENTSIPDVTEESVDVTQNTVKPVSTKKPDNKVEETKNTVQETTETKEPVTATTSPQQIITVAPTVTPTQTPQPSSWDIYFNKPSYWGDKVYIYIYDNSNDQLKNNHEWPGIEMTKVSDGYYRFTYKSEWYKVGRCLFSDGSNQYPEAGDENNATGVWLTGNMNISAE